MESPGSTDQRLDRLTVIVESLAASVVAHDNQLEAQGRNLDRLITLAEQQAARVASLEKR